MRLQPPLGLPARTGGEPASHAHPCRREELPLNLAIQAGRLNLVDVVIIVLLAGGIIAGFQRGSIMQIAAVAGLALGLTVARLKYRPLRDLLAPLPGVSGHSRWLTVVAFLLILFFIWGAVISIAAKIRFLVRLLLLGGLDRLAGALLGLLQSLVMVELLLYFGKRVHVHQIHLAITHSQLAPSFLHVVPYVHNVFPHLPR